MAAVQKVKANLEQNQMTDRSAESTLYSLILLDYSMPRVDGPSASKLIVELYKQYNANHEKQAAPPHIVCLTAFTEKVFEEKARQAGMNEFVSKPITNSRLKLILRKLKLIPLSDNNDEPRTAFD